ncbi:MAG: flavodoxin family protein [Chloroflexi bacterium]|nr:flavodoxin family protein [Chloroflexota bacterium]
MDVLGVMGSPRLKSNTHLLLVEALKGAAGRGAATKTMLVDKLNIAPCKEYYACLNDGNCIIRDDMDPVYGQLMAADAIIIAAPIFFYALPAQLKALIDRCQALWARRYVLKQPMPERQGAFIAVGATRGPRLFDGAILTIKYFFKAMNVTYADELLVRGVDERGEIKRRPEALAAAFELGARLARSGPPA